METRAVLQPRACDDGSGGRAGCCGCCGAGGKAADDASAWLPSETWSAGSCVALPAVDVPASGLTCGRPEELVPFVKRRRLEPDGPWLSPSS